MQTLWDLTSTSGGSSYTSIMAIVSIYLLPNTVYANICIVCMCIIYIYILFTRCTCADTSSHRTHATMKHNEAHDHSSKHGVNTCNTKPVITLLTATLTTIVTSVRYSQPPFHPNNFWKCQGLALQRSSTEHCRSASRIRAALNPKP